MKLQYNLTREAYESAIEVYINRHAGRLRFLSHILVGVSVVLILLALYVFLNSTDTSLTAWFVALWAVFFFVFAVLSNSKFKAKRFVAARIKAGVIPQGYFGSQIVELKENSIVVRHGLVSDRPYNAIIKVEDYPDTIMLFGNNAALDLITAKAFKDNDERNSFINTLNERITIAQNKAINNEQVAKSRAEARLVLDYSYDEAELIAALTAGNQVFVRTPLFLTGARIFTLLLGIGLIGLSIYMMVQGIGHIAISMLVLYIGGLMLLPMRLLFTPFLRGAVARTLRNGGFPNNAVGPQVLCFMEDRLKSYTLTAAYELSYDQIYAAKLTDEYLIFIGKAKTVHVFPVAAGELLKFISEKADVKLL